MKENHRITLGVLMAIVLLGLTGALLYFFHIGKNDISQDAAARIAVYARQMQRDGSWLVPVVRNQPRVDVPPLYLWAVRLTSLFAPESSWALVSRLPGAASAVALALLAAWWFHRHLKRYGREDLLDAPPEGFALLLGLLLATNPALVGQGREGTLNTMFTLFYAGAAFCFSESLEMRRSYLASQSWRALILYGYLLAGVAMLVHGPLVLPLLWVPYLMAAFSYRLMRPDRIHIYGLLLALLIGGSWPLLVSLQYPSVAAGLWADWVTLHLGSRSFNPTAYYHYLPTLLLAGFPWILLALVMIVRVARKQDRSPTLVFWTCSMIGNLIVMTLLSFTLGRRLLPVIIFALLMAGEALYRWNFENSWARAWRILLRLCLVLACVGGLFLSLLINSDLGLVLFALLPLVWLGWWIHTRTQGFLDSPWEVTLRLATLGIMALLAGEAVLVANWEPRRSIHNDWLSYFRRCDTALRRAQAPRLNLFRGGMSPLYDYYLDTPPALPLSVLRAEPQRELYLFSDRMIGTLNRNPKLDPMTYYWGERENQPSEGMFRLLPAMDRATSATTATTQRHPLRLALLGNAGTRKGGQREVARRLAKAQSKSPLDDVLMLGNNVYGPSIFDHLNFIKSFEYPYRRLHRDGVVFHAALGNEDQSYALIQENYPPSHMHKQRYYAYTLGGGQVDVFVLDSERLHTKAGFDEKQLKWLGETLAQSRAPWKVVGLWRALLTTATNGEADKALADRLLPLFDRYGVQVVAWSGGRWYERLSEPGHAPVFLNAGWSGEDRDAVFRNDPRRQAGYDRKSGYVLLELQKERATLTAINAKGEPVDHYQFGLKSTRK